MIIITQFSNERKENEKKKNEKGTIEIGVSLPWVADFNLRIGGGRVLGLSAEDHVHRGEDPGLPAAGQVVGRLEQHVVDVHRPLGRDPERRRDLDQHVVPPVGDPAHLQPRPPGAGGRRRQVPLLQHLEPHPPRGGGDVGVAAEPREGVAALDPLDDVDVVGVVAAVLVSGDPLVGDVEGAGLEDAEDLGVDLVEARGVAGGLDGVGAVEGGVGEGHLEEVAADDLAEAVEAGLLVVGAGAGHLVLVDGDADDAGAGVGGDGAHGPADAASDVEDAVVRGDADEVDGHLLVEAGGVGVGPAGEGGGEVEGLAPAPLVDVGDEVVEGVDEVGDLLLGLDLLGAAEEGPVAVVVVLDLLGGDGAAGDVRGPLPLLLRRPQHADEPVDAAGDEGSGAPQSHRVHGFPP